jgi:hypothetical protein
LRYFVKVFEDGLTIMLTKQEKYMGYVKRKRYIITKMDDKKLEIIPRIGFDDRRNNVNIGVRILSESKRIMSELFDYCDSNGILVTYSAIDFILIPFSKLPLLDKAMGIRWGFEDCC